MGKYWFYMGIRESKMESIGIRGHIEIIGYTLELYRGYIGIIGIMFPNSLLTPSKVGWGLGDS